MQATSNKSLANLSTNLLFLFQLLMDFKVLGLLFINGMLIYGIGWDTILRPKLELFKRYDESLAVQQKQLQEREALTRQYTQMEKELESLDTFLTPVPPGSSAKVFSVSQAAEILALLEGKARDAQLGESLPSPHNQREGIDLKPIGSEVIDILKPEAQGSAADPAASAGGGATPAAPAGSVASGVPAQLGSTTLPVERYDYELKITSTYAGLMDVLNELLMYKHLIRFNKITISRSKVQTMDSQPNAQDDPDYPVKLEMVMSISFYLYSKNG